MIPKCPFKTAGFDKPDECDEGGEGRMTATASSRPAVNPRTIRAVRERECPHCKHRAQPACPYTARRTVGGGWHCNGYRSRYADDWYEGELPWRKGMA